MEKSFPDGQVALLADNDNPSDSGRCGGIVSVARVVFCVAGLRICRVRNYCDD
ncbi:MAG TPA: hypothetical protein VGP07_05990 [Polyangia bacterium]|jgi:hypothetical protein